MTAVSMVVSALSTMLTSTWGYAAATAIGLAAGDGEPNNFGNTRGSSGVAGPLAGVIIVLLAIGTVLLIRNMNKRLRRLPTSFDAQGDAPVTPSTGHQRDADAPDSPSVEARRPRP